MKLGRWLFFAGILTALAGAELVLINTILVLGNAVWYVTNLERIIEGCLFYIAGFVSIAVGWTLIEEATKNNN